MAGDSWTGRVLVEAPVIIGLLRPEGRQAGEVQEAEEVLLTALCDFREEAGRLVIGVRDARLDGQEFCWRPAEFGNAVRAAHESAAREFTGLTMRTPPPSSRHDEDARHWARRAELSLRSGRFEEAVDYAEVLLDRKWLGDFARSPLGDFSRSPLRRLTPTRISNLVQSVTDSLDGSSDAVRDARREVASHLRRVAGRLEDDRPFTALAHRLEAAP
ncbi:hypothetical protein [Streptomyces sp. NPDC001135]